MEESHVDIGDVLLGYHWGAAAGLAVNHFFLGESYLASGLIGAAAGGTALFCHEAYQNSRRNEEVVEVPAETALDYMENGMEVDDIMVEPVFYEALCDFGSDSEGLEGIHKSREGDPAYSARIVENDHGEIEVDFRAAYRAVENGKELPGGWGQSGLETPLEVKVSGTSTESWEKTVEKLGGQTA